MRKVSFYRTFWMTSLLLFSNTGSLFADISVNDYSVSLNQEIIDSYDSRKVDYILRIVGKQQAIDVMRFIDEYSLDPTKLKQLYFIKNSESYTLLELDNARNNNIITSKTTNSYTNLTKKTTNSKADYYSDIAPSNVNYFVIDKSQITAEGGEFYMAESIKPSEKWELEDVSADQQFYIKELDNPEIEAQDSTYKNDQMPENQADSNKVEYEDNTQVLSTSVNIESTEATVIIEENEVAEKRQAPKPSFVPDEPKKNSNHLYYRQKKVNEDANLNEEPSTFLPSIIPESWGVKVSDGTAEADIEIINTYNKQFENPPLSDDVESLAVGENALGVIYNQDIESLESQEDDLILQEMEAALQNPQDVAGEVAENRAQPITEIDERVRRSPLVYMDMELDREDYLRHIAKLAAQYIPEIITPEDFYQRVGRMISLMWYLFAGVIFVVGGLSAYLLFIRRKMQRIEEVNFKEGRDPLDYSDMMRSVHRLNVLYDDLRQQQKRQHDIIQSYIESLDKKIESKSPVQTIKSSPPARGLSEGNIQERSPVQEKPAQEKPASKEASNLAKPAQLPQSELMHSPPARGLSEGNIQERSPVQEKPAQEKPASKEVASKEASNLAKPAQLPQSELMQSPPARGLSEGNIQERSPVQEKPAQEKPASKEEVASKEVASLTTNSLPKVINTQPTATIQKQLPLRPVRDYLAIGMPNLVSNKADNKVNHWSKSDANNYPAEVKNNDYIKINS